MTDPLKHPIPREDVSYVDEEYSPLPDRSKPSAKELAARPSVRAQRDNSELLDVLAFEPGRGVLLRILGFCSTYAHSFVLGHPDASAFNEGKRAVGVWLTRKIHEIDQEAYAKLLLTNVKREHELNQTND